MSKEEETPARVTRGALRRMSVEQEPTSAPGTPKKVTASTKKPAAAVLDAIQEGSTGPSDIEEDSSAATSTTNTKKDTSSAAGNKSLQKVKEQEAKPPPRTRAASLTEDNISALENFGEARRTPRRRPSQDTTLTPQTVPTATRRKTRRNSATSDDGILSTTTPKASKSRLSVAPPTIAEDDEKEDKANSSSNATLAEADLSDLDIRKLRNRSISNSPVPRSSPCGKNTSLGSHKADEDEVDTCKTSSPTKESNTGSESVTEVPPVSDAESTVDKTPTKGEVPKSATPAGTPVENVKKQLKDVTFEEGTPKQLDKSVYPKTPIPSEKRRKLSEKADESLSTTSEVIDETLQESPEKTNQKVATPKSASPAKSTSRTPQKTGETLDQSVDMSLAVIVEDVRQNLNQADESISVLDTPKPSAMKHKSHFSHLREGTSSTPIAKTLPEVEEEEAEAVTAESPKASKSWTQAVKGTSSGKGIDVFSVRKQEEQKQQEEEAKQLNESLKRKAVEKKVEVEDEDEEAEEEEEDDAPERNSFLDDEAMEVEGYQSGDSLDSETREEMDANKVDDEGESLGSEDSEQAEEEEDEDDSFIASDGEELELLDGSGDDIESEEEESKSKSKKKHKRIIQPLDSSDEEQSAINLDETNTAESKSPKKTPKKSDSDKSESPKKTPAKGTPAVSMKKTPSKDTPQATPKKTPAKGISEASPKKNTPQATPSSKTPLKTPSKDTLQATPSSTSPKKTHSENPPVEDEKNDQSFESLNASCSVDQLKSPVPKAASNSVTPKKTPIKIKDSPAKGQNPATPAKSESQKESSPRKSQTPSKDSLKAETEQATDNLTTIAMEIDASAGKSDNPKSRKSLPAPALISADFYVSSAKKAAKRNTINVLDDGNPTEQETEPEKPSKYSPNLVTNPAALALAKKNKRLSLEGASPAEPATKRDKRASLPGDIPDDKEIQSPLKRKKKNAIPEEDVAELDAVEPMDVDECEEEEEDQVTEKQSPVKKPAQPVKKKSKDLSEFDTSAILARCNEVVRSDKEKRKQSATLRQKKKDEKRRQREEEQQEEAVEGDESMEQQKKKKKKKKKPTNYLLEELGEKKEDQVAKALQRRMALLEAKRERKKAKKAAKLQQLNKENQHGKDEKNEGIGAKFEKKAKKDKKAKKAQKPAVEEAQKPVVKVAISAYAMYSTQIEELKSEQASKRKPKSKQLKEKNHQPSAAEEVQEALHAKVESKSKKDKETKTLAIASESTSESNESHRHDKKKGGAEKDVSTDKPTKEDHHKKKDGTASKQAESTSASPTKTSLNSSPSDEKLKEDKSTDVASKKHIKKKKDKPSTTESSEPLDEKKKSERMDLLFGPLKSVVNTNDDVLATLKKSLTEPITKVVKKQKLSQSNSTSVTVSVAESTPPRRLKALSQLEQGFREEPVTPEQKLLKRNHGFKEEPITPKTVGFKVSNILPTGQEELQLQAVLAKKKKTHSTSNRIRPEDVKEPAKGLPLPIWTRSGTFEVEELSEAKSKKSKAATDSRVEGDVIPLNVNGGGQCSTDFLVKSLGGKKKEHLAGAGTAKAHRIDSATVDEGVVNFKKQAIFGKNAHLREKKTKH